MPVAWSKPSAAPPKPVWDDSGHGGRPATLWSNDGDVNGGTMLMALSSSRQKPPTELRQLLAKELAVAGF